MKLAVFLDTSVIIAAMGSESGGSHRLLQYCHDGFVKGFINQEVFKEVYTRASKVNFPQTDIEKFLLWSNVTVLPRPTTSQIQSYSSSVSDPKDRHLFASAGRIPSCILISLDKKHVLSIRNKIARFKILSPKEFLQILA